MRSTANPVEKEAAKETLLRDSFALALREARLRQGIRSQAALAKMSGVPEYVVGALERGDKPIDLKVIAKICGGMRIDIDAFLEEVRQIQVRLLLPVKAELRGEGTNQQENKRRAVPVDLGKALDVVGEALKKLVLGILEEQTRVERAVPIQEQLRKPGRKKRRSGPGGEG